MQNPNEYNPTWINIDANDVIIADDSMNIEMGSTRHVYSNGNWNQLLFSLRNRD